MATASIQVNQEQGIWRWFFGLAALEAGAAFVALAWLPHEGAAVSLARGLMLAVLAACFFAAIGFALRPPRWLAMLSRPSIILSVAILSLLLAVALFLLRFLDPPVLLPYYQRLAALLLYLIGLGIQASILLLVLTYGIHPEGASGHAGTLRPAAIALSGLALVFCFVAITRVGLTPDSAYWGEPGVPLLGWQLALALLGGLGLLIAGLHLHFPARIDLYIGIGVWLLAVLIWLSVPARVTRNSFYAPITPPDSQSYPNSDAGYYDSMAESLLIGQPYQGEIPTRPLYILILLALHLIAGEDYALITAGQTLLLALIPVLLYLLGKAVHSRTAGLMAALIAIFRELTTILVSSQTRVSDTRTLLVDLPTLLAILLACWLAVQWLSGRDRQTGLLAGGVFGLMLLLRTQSLLIAPFLLVVVMAAGFRSRRWMIPAGLFVVGLIAAAAPWLVHNYLRTGQLSLDAPFQYQIIASQYQYTGNLDIGQIDLQGKSVAGILITFLLKDPKFVLGFVATHSLATQIDGLLALPLSHNYAGLNAPIDLYWINWESQLGPLNIALLGAYLAVIAIGLGAAWRRLKWAGLVPLVFSLAYSLANGLGRFSGWRYDLPADWISYFYFSVGVAELLAAGALLLGADVQRLFTPGENAARPGMRARSIGLLIVAFMLIGALPWIAEGVASPHYADQDRTHFLAVLGASSALSGSGITPVALESFAASPSVVVQTGRLLYPRFFSRDQGLASAHPWPAYAPRDFPRLGFLLLNQTRHDVVFPSRQLAGSFPQGADVIVLGCQRADHVEARLVFFPSSDSVYTGVPFDQPCQ